MPLTNDGRDQIAALIVNGGQGSAPTHYGSANAYIGVGTDNTAFAATQTDLNPGVAGSKTYQAMDSGYPTVSSNVLTLRSTYATGSANHAWEEWGVFNGDPGGTPPSDLAMLSRYVQSLGTKTSAQTWEITVTLNVVIGT